MPKYVYMVVEEEGRHGISKDHKKRMSNAYWTSNGQRTVN